MLKKYSYDPEFPGSSKILKQVLSGIYPIEFRTCLDIPCGNGRNIFLLASFFDQVTGIDINHGYLEEIESVMAIHRNISQINLKQADLLNEEATSEISSFSFISNIHFYNYSLLSRIIEKMNKDALLFIETQSCAGENYKELPTQEEINKLFRNSNVLFFKSNVCRSENMQAKSMAFKALLKKK